MRYSRRALRLGSVRIYDLIILILELLDDSTCPAGQRYAMPLDLAQRVITPTLRQRNQGFIVLIAEVFTEALGQDLSAVKPAIRACD